MATQLEEATAAVGGDLELVRELRDGIQDLFPAKSTVEEVRLYELEYRGLAKILTSEQCKQLRWMATCPASSCWLLQAPSGTGKSILIVKFATSYLVRLQAIAIEDPDVKPLPLLILTPSIALQEHLVALACQELGDECTRVSQ